MSSTSFFGVYVALCGGLYVANVWAARRADRAPGRSGAQAPLEPYALALLNGGPRQVVATAVATLRSRGQLTDGVAPGIVAVTGKTDAPAHPLERAVYEAVNRTGQLPIAALERDAAVDDAIKRLGLQLTRSGELIDRRTIAWIRGLWLGGPVVLVALGTVRLASAWDYYGDEAMRWLLLAVIWTAVVLVWNIVFEWALDRRPVPSARGRAALANWGERDPAMISTEEEWTALSAALADQSDAPAVTTGGEARPVQVAGGGRMLLAEEILLLGGAQNPDERPPIEAGTLLAGALLVELAALGRLTIATPPGEKEPFVSILDRELTGDELLDNALALLADPTPVTTATSDGWRLRGRASRRRLRARGRVSERDLVAWWRDAWTCAEFPELEPTLLRQILTLHERLHPLEDLIATRLVADGVLRQRFTGSWPYVLVTHNVREDLRRRVHAATLTPEPLLEPCTNYLIAICATYTSWLTNAVSADGDRRQIRASASIALRHDPVAPAVDVIVRKGYAAFDD